MVVVCGGDECYFAGLDWKDSLQSVFFWAALDFPSPALCLISHVLV